MKNIEAFAYDYLERFYTKGVIYPIEAKYLNKIGRGGYYTDIVLRNSIHKEYLAKKQRVDKANEVRIARAYLKAYAMLSYSVEHNSGKINNNPLIAMYPIFGHGKNHPISSPSIPRKLLSCKGVYFLYQKGKILYVGSSKNIYLRIKQHCFDGRIPFDCFKFFLMGDEYDMSDVIDFEYFYIEDLNPPYNKRKKR